MKAMKIVTGSIGSHPIVTACNNYQVTNFPNKSITWCDDYNLHNLVMECFNLYCMVIFVDGSVPLSTIDGIGDVHNIDTEEGNNTVHKMGIFLYPLLEILMNRACVCIYIHILNMI